MRPFTLLALFALACAATVMVMAILKQNAESLACQNSLELLAILKYLPYELRASSMTPVVPTVNKLQDCLATFFETDASERTTNLFQMSVSDDGSILTGEHFYCCFCAAGKS